MSLEKATTLFTPFRRKQDTLTNWGKHLATNKKIQKSNIIFEGFRHPNFMNPFEYCHSLESHFQKELEQLKLPLSSIKQKKEPNSLVPGQNSPSRKANKERLAMTQCTMRLSIALRI